jgi:hypothetical protein
MSLITSALVGARWPSQAKALVAFLMCIVGALIPIAVAGVDLTNMVLVLPLMWIGSQVFYRVWFKPTGIAPWIETLFFNTQSQAPNGPTLYNPIQRHDMPYDRSYHDEYYDDEPHP